MWGKIKGQIRINRSWRNDWTLFPKIICRDATRGPQGHCSFSSGSNPGYAVHSYTQSLVLACLPQLSDLGLEREILSVPHDHVASKNRFLYMNGTIHKLPSSLRSDFITHLYTQITLDYMMMIMKMSDDLPPALSLSLFSGVVKTVPPFSSPIILSVMKEVLVRKGKQEDESVHSFISRRFGSEVGRYGLVF